MVSIPACHAGDPGSIPGNGVPFLQVVELFILSYLWTGLPVTVQFGHHKEMFIIGKLSSQ